MNFAMLASICHRRVEYKPPLEEQFKQFQQQLAEKDLRIQALESALAVLQNACEDVAESPDSPSSSSTTRASSCTTWPVTPCSLPVGTGASGSLAQAPAVEISMLDARAAIAAAVAAAVAPVFADSKPSSSTQPPEVAWSAEPVASASRAPATSMKVAVTQVPQVPQQGPQLQPAKAPPVPVPRGIGRGSSGARAKKETPVLRSCCSQPDLSPTSRSHTDAMSETCTVRPTETRTPTKQKTKEIPKTAPKRTNPRTLEEDRQSRRCPPWPPSPSCFATTADLDATLRRSELLLRAITAAVVGGGGPKDMDELVMTCRRAASCPQSPRLQQRTSECGRAAASGPDREA